jgi:Protein of unknown function (DUF1353)
MAHFTGPCVNEQIGSQRWRVYEAFSFHSVTGLVVDVPKGFEHDFASIPAVFQGMISKCSYYSQAAIVHDLLYRNHRNGLDTTVSRLQADNILLEGCRVRAVDFGVPDSERRDWLIYGGVRIGGRDSWLSEKDKAEIQAGDLPAYYDQ